MSSPKKLKLVKKYLRLMEKKLGRPNNPAKRPLLDQIVFFHLYSFGGNNRAKRALREFAEEYVDWNEVRVSSLGQIGETVSKHGITLEAAPVLKDFLNQIYTEHDTLNIEFLREETVEFIRKFFLKVNALLPGTVPFILMANKGAGAVPPETPVRRLAERIGLAGKGATRGKLNKVFRDSIPEKEAYKFFMLAVEHLRTVCLPEIPKCQQCPMTADCDFAAREKARSERLKSAGPAEAHKRGKSRTAHDFKKKKKKRRLTRRARRSSVR
jgi:endonuclease-3